MKFALGTAQFGLNYGIANTLGKVGKADARAILDSARTLGINTIDTAAAYGDSEACLGDLGVADFQLITKVPPWSGEIYSVDNWIQAHLAATLNRLRVQSVYGLLLHRSDMINRSNVKKIATLVDKAKKERRLVKFGVSVYDPEELDRIEGLLNFDIVQVPLNILDRRIVSSGWLQKLYDRGVEVHVRSVFLQGLLLMKRDQLPERFERWESLFNVWYEWLGKEGADPIRTCLSAVRDARISRVVIGVDSIAQLHQISLAATDFEPTSFPNLECNDLDLIKPSNWN